MSEGAPGAGVKPDALPLAAQRSLDWARLPGLPLLWVCGYCLPLMAEGARYFRPGATAVLWLPSAVAVLVLTPVMALAFRSRWMGAAWLQATWLWVLLVIAVTALFAGADYPWPRALEAVFGPDTSGRQKQFARVLTLVLAAAAVAWAWRARGLRRLAEALSALGYALALLVVMRFATQELQPPEPWHGSPGEVQALPGGLQPVSVQRRVVWLILDEFDDQFARHYRLADGLTAMPNYQRLRAMALSAQQANPPARDTFAALPALLSGRAVAGVRQLGPAQLAMRDAATGHEFRFEQGVTVFDRLAGGAGQASITGFYHPYCDIVVGLAHCEAAFLALAGQPLDALIYVLPKFLHPSFNEHHRITAALWPGFLKRVGMQGEALTFGHINVPHLPAAFVQQRLGVPPVRDLDGMYRQNLLLADLFLGELIDAVQRPGAVPTLVVVSSDHWWRALDMQRARPVPFVVWRVGSTEPLDYTAPFSTVHTAALALAFLEGQLDGRPASVAAWMAMQPFSPTWVPPAEPGATEAARH